ncbi:hypothetical protein A2W14_05945 [Candidatus Gottesmanbacteria bacterium RBG_16_37_8]|uniref:Uncharacterized protein n=1 Tax=Candidatus Gottesmanbacteria bacterium RBG_16_37_8 TaxID=1798371 RepID=A0A1F5YV41_9BACT|nr:MAG: hypothetical protein A2W14_05945 [Candidatus Gottesmanbacteria bacterium RBG_16_37_8]
MKKENKKLYNKKLLVLAIISLIIIFFIVFIGTLSGRYTFWLKRWNGSLVLGINDKLPLSKIASENIENLLEGAFDSTKKEVSKKVIESQEKLKTSLEKEISSMTSSQIRAFQLKLCQDWGITGTTSATTQ